MPKLLIKNGRVMDPASGLDEVADVFVNDGKIVEIGSFKAVEKDLPAGQAGVEVIDATGKLVIPGVIDLHVHLRDMEQSEKETIATGTAAAVAGGVTTVLCMPNTVPRFDNSEIIHYYHGLIEKSAKNHVLIAGAITARCEGKALADLSQYPGLGIRFITDDGFDVDDEELLEEAFKKAAKLGLIVMVHPEVMSMPGVVNEGKVSKKLGVPGQPNEKEWKAVERAIHFANTTEAYVHLTHITTKESAELVRKAKKTMKNVTCDATPHHLMLTEEAVLRLGSLAKVNPPLRTETDRQALIAAAKDGTIDCIVTDHAPHEEKDPDFTKAAFGFTGLETLIPAILTELYFNQKMDLMKVIGLLTSAPAKLAGLPSGRIAPDAPADLTIIDLNLEKKADRQKLVSKGKNSPFHGMTLRGWPVRTIIGEPSAL
ncbi:MAG: dihydroorotase [Candidatus Peregrinibacteria bacterium]